MLLSIFKKHFHFLDQLIINFYDRIYARIARKCLNAKQFSKRKCRQTINIFQLKFLLKLIFASFWAHSHLNFIKFVSKMVLKSASKQNIFALKYQIFTRKFIVKFQNLSRTPPPPPKPPDCVPTILFRSPLPQTKCLGTLLNGTSSHLSLP